MKRHRSIGWLLVLITLTVAGVLLVEPRTGNGLQDTALTAVPGPSLSHEQMMDFEDGDLVFRRGNSLESRAVLLADEQSHFSHVGVLVWRQGVPWVAHAVPETEDMVEGAQLQTLSAFLDPSAALDWGVFRLAPAPSSTDAASQAAQRALVMAEAELPFDDAFDTDDASAVYCTELVWRAYREAGIDLVDNKFDRLSFAMFDAERVILPSRLIASPYLKRLSSEGALE